MDAFDLRKWHGFSQAGGDNSMEAIVEDIVIDSRRITPAKTLFVALPGKHVDGHDFIAAAGRAGARYAIVAKNYKKTDASAIQLLHVESPLAAFQEIVEAYRETLATAFIAVCGSYGKTMVKDLLASMLDNTFHMAMSPESFNSQIGVPLSILQVGKEHQLAIIEAGTSHQGELAILARMIKPQYTIVTKIGKKHITTLGSLQQAAMEFATVTQAAKQWALIPNHPHLSEGLQNSCRIIHWDNFTPTLPHICAIDSSNNNHVNCLLKFPDGTLFNFAATSGFTYVPELINICTKAAFLLGVPADDICEGLQRANLQPMRTEIWRASNGATIINDHYCSDPQSVDKALLWFQQMPAQAKKIFAFGGFKGREHASEQQLQRLAKSLSKIDLEHLYLYDNHPFEYLVNALAQNHGIKNISVFKDWQRMAASLKTSMKANTSTLIKGAEKIPFDILTQGIEDTLYSNHCRINLAAIKDNVAALQAKIGAHRRLLVMVKALAYGTDDVRIAQYLAASGVDILGVSYVEEACTLFRQGISQEILVLNTAPYEIAKAVKHSFTLCVSNETMIAQLASAAAEQNKTIKVHLHIDTGMSRFGCRPEESVRLAQLINKHPQLIFDGIMTHFAAADDPAEDVFTKQQIAIFESCTVAVKAQGYNPAWIHAANSSAAIRFDIPFCNMVRIGLAVYGLYPSQATQEAIDLRLAFSLTSRITGINHLKQGDTISYGRTYRVEKESMRIGVLPIGYHDGIHRHYSGASYVNVIGKLAPMVGRICMDYMLIDLTDIPEAEIGDSVLIFGEDEHGNFIAPEDLAQKGRSIIHELICCLGPRIPRIFIHEEHPQHR